MSRIVWICALCTIALAGDAHAARIGDILEAGAWEQALRFLRLEDTTVKLALGGSVLLGITCGLLGSFLVVRKLALVGDVLSHAVLPGVTAGFLWNLTKDPVAIFIGATIAGLFGTMVVSWITHTTKLKEDTAMALVLAVFFGVGLVLMGIIQQLPDANKSGIDKTFFGQAAALSGSDVKFMGGVAAATILLLTVFYKELLVTSFDAVFARTIGIRVAWVHYSFMFLLSAAVVVALQAVGVVLVSAMLITPAATAYLLTNRMHKMVVLSAVLGVVAGTVGAFLSFLGSNLPTGPCMVITASTLFGAALLFSPLHGVVPRWARRTVRMRRSRRENMLKAIYQISESDGHVRDVVNTGELATHRKLPPTQVSHEIAGLAAAGLVIFEQGRSSFQLTAEGRRQAETVVRNHRLWELYLTERANFRADHVHEDAEEIEHVLGEETVRLLERRLGYPERDPHGKTIPRPQ
jgi:ABC-type Mn2+/Zn2+ transport system permease subunit/Mn-dependent DtxR family transcriptional regulator